jgi:microcystin-dependent protein
MDVYIGTVCIFGFNYAPYGFAFCQGQILSIAANTALFSLLGTFYGGNGTSTFGLPNLQGRAALDDGTGISTYFVGDTGGVTSATILTSNMPLHTHNLSLSINANPGGRSGASSSSPVGNFPAPSVNVVNDYNSTPTGGSFMQPATVSLSNVGSGIPISIANPYLVLNYCVALYGIYPTRN